MAVVFALKRESARANSQQIPETDSVDIATIVRSTAGLGALYNDSSTTTVSLGAGSAVTGVTVGGGAAYTGSTIGRSGQTDTFLGHVTVNGNLQVNGSSTIVNATSITTQDTLIESGVSTRGTAGQNLAFAFYGGSNASKDAMIYWVQASTRLDFGYGDTGATGGTLPSAPTTWVDVKLNNLTVAGTTVTGVGGSLTLTIASANLTLSTTTSGTLAITSAGALNHTSVAASTWTHSGGAFAINSTSQSITIATLTSGTLALTSAGALNATSAAASTWTHSGGTWLLSSTSAAVTIQTTTSGVISLLGAGAITITAAAASTWSTSSGALTITSAAAATWSTSAGLLSITGTGGLTLTASGATDLTFSARSGTNYTFNDGSNTALNGGFTGVTSIIGALNFLFTNPVATANTIATTYTNNNAGTITQGQCVYIVASNAVDLTNATADTGPANFVGVVSPAGGIATTASGSIVSEGVALVRIKTARHVPAINDEIFLDVANNGYGVSFAADAGANPSTAGNVVKSIGYVKNLNGNTAGNVLGADGLVFVHLIPGTTKMII